MREIEANSMNIKMEKTKRLQLSIKKYRKDNQNKGDGKENLQEVMVYDYLGPDTKN